MLSGRIQRTYAEFAFPSMATVLCCLLLSAGCGERHDEGLAATEAATNPGSVQADSGRRSTTNMPTVVPSALIDSKRSSRHSSAIRLTPLADGLFPQIVPENGARHGYTTILESLGSGGAAMDFDRDGWPDVLIGGGGDFDGRSCVGQRVFILRNCQTGFEDATEVSTVGSTRFYHHGISTADFNHDGFADFLVAGFGGVQLFYNHGDGTFTESTAFGELIAGGWYASAAWGDFNHDGHLDVYVTGYVDWSFDNDPPCFAADGKTRDNCSPKIFEPVPDTLLISRGDGSFADQTEIFQIRSDGKALGVVAADFDADGFLDIYVGNDVMMNFLYRNEGGASFADWSSLSGAGVSRRGSPDASMGVDVVDFNNDGLFDLWAANFELESFALYQNLGEMQFQHVSDATGISAIGPHYVGWGTSFVDLDLDGDTDVVVCNGNVVQHPKHSPTLQRMVLLENIEGEYFENVTSQAGSALTTPRHGRGLAWTDWNRDGRIDLLTTPTHAPAELLQNDSEVPGSSLTVQLVGTKSPRQPIGTVVVLSTSKGMQYRQLIGGGSYASTSLAEIHFGLPGDSEQTELHIRWPSGCEQTVSAPESDKRIVVIERLLEQTPLRDAAGPHRFSCD